MDLTSTTVRALLSQPEQTPAEIFALMSAIGSEGMFGNRDVARDALIRLVDRNPNLDESATGLLQLLLREHGLFPYVTPERITLASDAIAYQYHRRPRLFEGRDWVFHREQSRVFELLRGGSNVVLSAPTSFGKSALIDAVVRERKFRNVVIIVPTLALMDETRRRLVRRFGDKYRVITHGSMRTGKRNMFVMTQERFLEVDPSVHIDFFVIDEFYKLAGDEEDSRSTLLNTVLGRLLKTGAQFYMLGPGISSLTELSQLQLDATFIATSFSTVAVDVEFRPTSAEQQLDRLSETIASIDGSTIVYCRSPQRTRDVAEAALGSWASEAVSDLSGPADWIATTYHPDWIVARALRNGVGIHHARMPRALAMHMLRLFNEGRVKQLLVTSTLIEGVNSVAKNVVILDNKLGTKKFDYFTYANIRGRAGRMSEHFVGRVIVLAPAPAVTQTVLDIPVLSQSDRASDALLLQIPESDLTDRSRERVAALLDQELLSAQTLRANRGIDPNAQLELARAFREQPRRWQAAFRWNGAYPDSSQLKTVSEAMFSLANTKTQSVRTAAQLAYRINSHRHHNGNMAAIVADQVSQGTEPEKAIEDFLDFSRSWAQFHIPNTLTAAGRIAEQSLPANARVANPGVFSGLVENLFLSPHVASLEEYGLPVPLTEKLRAQRLVRVGGSFDDLLAQLAIVDYSNGGLVEFEREMLADVVLTLPGRLRKKHRQ